MRILIADDRKESRLALRKMLQSAGYMVVDACNGVEAIEIARKTLPDMFISDILMPEMDGFKLCRELKRDERFRDIPFVFYTAAYLEPEDEKLGLALGAAGFIRKPVDIDAFLNTIRSIVSANGEGKSRARQLPDEAELGRMYDHSLSRQLSAKVKELEEKQQELLQKKTALRESEEKYRMIFENSPLGILHFSKDGFATACNDAFAAIIGAEREKIVGFNMRTSLKDEKMKAAVASCLSGAAGYYEGNYRSVLGDKITPLKARYAPMLSPEGTVTGGIAVFEDITAQKRYEETLRQVAEELSSETGEAFFLSLVKLLARNLGAAFAFIGELSDTGAGKVQTVAVYASGQIADNFEYDLADTPCEQVIGKTMCTFPSNVQHHFPADKMLEDMGIESYIGMPLFDSGNHPIGLLVVMDKKPFADTAFAEFMLRLVSVRTAAELERRSAEEKLQESEEKYRLLFDGATDGILLADIETKKFFAGNKMIQSMLGYDEDEIRGLSVFDLHPKKDLPHVLEQFEKQARRVIRTAQAIPVKRKDGSVFYADINSSPLKIRKKTYLMGIFRDTTEQRELKEQLLHAQKMEAVGQLAGGIAHDFNNMLTALIGYGNLLKIRLKDNDDLTHIINQILGITERGSNLIRDLLAFSRKQVVELKPVHLSTMIENSLRLLPKLVNEKTEIKKNFTTVTLVVMADSVQLEQVLMNLALNARDAMPQGGVLTIATERVTIDGDFIETYHMGVPGAYALLSVSDTGTGIDEEILDKIFEPFFTTKEVGKGSGLGLAMVYGIVKQHNGFIMVFSEVGKGTTFNIYLPLSIKSIGAARKTELSVMDRGTETVLLAEDEPDVRSAVKTILEEFGFSVVEAVDGEDAVSKFREGAIDLLHFDVAMPNKSGLEAYEEIRRTAPGVRVIFTSGYAWNIQQARSILTKDLNFIAKPVHPAQLIKEIRKVLDA